MDLKFSSHPRLQKFKSLIRGVTKEFEPWGKFSTGVWGNRVLSAGGWGQAWEAGWSQNAVPLAGWCSSASAWYLWPTGAQMLRQRLNGAAKTGYLSYPPKLHYTLTAWARGYSHGGQYPSFLLKLCYCGKRFYIHWVRGEH